MKNEPDSVPSVPKKMKFKPKMQQRKQSKPPIAKSEPVDSKLNSELLARVKNLQSRDGFGMRRNEKKFSQPQVSFGYGGESTFARSYSKTSAGANDGDDESAQEEYVEPYDYNHSYYPTNLPLRMPYCGDPENLNEQEFGEASTSSALDETSTPAQKLNLMGGTDEPQLLFFQLPASLPFPTQSNENLKDKASSSKNGSGTNKGFNLERMPSGFMGKLLVYKNGDVKMKLGDTLFDVSPGSDCVFAQEVAAINLREKECCVVGELSNRAIVTPDIDALLESIEHMN